MATMAAPREGPARTGLFLCRPFLTASELRGTCPLWGEEGPRSWLLGFQFWPQRARSRNPKISPHETQNLGLEHQKRKNCWGSLRKGK